MNGIRGMRKSTCMGGGYVTDTGKQTDDCFVITLCLPVGGAVSVIMLQLLLYCNIICTSLYQAAEIIKTTARNITAGTHYKQVGVQLQRTLTTWHCPHLLLRAVLRRGAGHAAIDRYLLPATPTAANPPHSAAAGEWDRQTDGPRTVR